MGKKGSREALLDAAEELFTRREYSAVGTRELAEAARVNLGAIQYHFGSKANLFIEALRRLVAKDIDIRVESQLKQDLQSVEEASVELARFIRLHLRRVMCHTQPNLVRWIYRELFGALAEEPEVFNALTTVVIEAYGKPLEEAMRKIVAALRPDLNAQEQGFTTYSIVGQNLFYFTHRAFLERLKGSSYSEAELNQIADHITRFSFLGLGLPLAAADAGIAAARDIELNPCEERSLEKMSA